MQYGEDALNGNPDVSYVSNQDKFPLGDNRKFLAPFWADVDTTDMAGNVWYRRSTNTDLLSKASDQIRRAFPLVESDFTAEDLIIVTWDKVGYYNKKSDKVMKFR